MKRLYLVIYVLTFSINFLTTNAFASDRISDPELGVSILPPQGEGWHYINNRNGGVMFGKQINGPSHTFICSLVVVRTGKTFEISDKFLEAVKQAQERNLNKKRFKDFKSDYKLNTRFWAFVS